MRKRCTCSIAFRRQVAGEYLAGDSFCGLPRRVLFTDALPRNATGKVLKHELRRMLAAGSFDTPSPRQAG